MKLITSDHELKDICKDIESKVVGIDELSNITLNVSLVENFSNNSIGLLIPDNPAAYWKDSNEIQLSQNFIDRQYFERIAIIMHEVGEAYIEKNNIPNLKSENLPVTISLPKDILVDRYVCKWGFKNEIVQSRRSSSYGEKYAKNLEGWRNLSNYIQQMSVWHFKRISD